MHFKGLYKQDRQKKKLGGRPPLDCVMMLKVLMLQDMHKLSGDQAPSAKVVVISRQRDSNST